NGPKGFRGDRGLRCASSLESEETKTHRNRTMRGSDLRNIMVRLGSNLSRHRQGSGDCALVLITQGLAQMERVPPTGARGAVYG
ncbi:MAG: hypothetical protein JWP83_4380, partial [Mycobacterium sp.]|nr:hypothetical protein [Mycobacterium sp.]